MRETNPDTPDLVRQTLALAARMGFAHSSTAATGRFLHLLTRAMPHGVIGETGTGCGAGAAWIVSALAPTARFVTVERDPARAAAVRESFAGRANVLTLQGDWAALLAHGPFDLLFVDGGPRVKGDLMEGTPPDEEDVRRVLDAVRPGGLIILDDLTPTEDQPPELRTNPDTARAFWLHDPRVMAMELRVDPRGGIGSVVILAVRSDDRRLAPNVLS